MKALPGQVVAGLRWRFTFSIEGKAFTSCQSFTSAAVAKQSMREFVKHLNEGLSK
jgi:hypothetical protein